MLANREEKQGVLTLNTALSTAEKGAYAVGSFSPRYIPMIRPVLKAGEKTNSVIIVQISQNELNWYDVKLEDFATEFYSVLNEEKISVPVVLHLDHTKDFEVIKTAITAGFTSVMIDASDKPFEENVAITSKVVKYAHSYNVSVEAELGKIGTTDFVETDQDEELYTDPQEAKEFVDKTGIDALAVSVGTAHGVYAGEPKLDFDRLDVIKKKIGIPVVLHGASGVPEADVKKSVSLGVNKVNVNTDFQQAFNSKIRDIFTNDPDVYDPRKFCGPGRDAIKAKVIEKIKFLGSDNKA